MADCKMNESCGGMFSSGPGDSDWQSCDRHSVDLPIFDKIYTLQLQEIFTGKRDPFLDEINKKYKTLSGDK